MSVDRRTTREEAVQRVGALLQAVLVVLIAYLTVAAVALPGTRALVSAGVIDADGIGWDIAASILQFVGFGIGTVGYLALRDDLDVLGVRVPTLRDLAYVAAGLVGILLVAVAVDRILSQFGVSVAQNQVIVTGMQNPEFFLYMIPVAILFVGPFEELLFRGAVQGLLDKAYPSAAAIVIASGMFGLVHWIALTGSGDRLPYVVVAAGLGLILGYVYDRTGNLVVPALVHGAYNAVLFGFQYAVATGLV